MAVARTESLSSSVANWRATFSQLPHAVLNTGSRTEPSRSSSSDAIGSGHEVGEAPIRASSRGLTTAAGAVSPAIATLCASSPNMANKSTTQPASSNRTAASAVIIKTSLVRLTAASRAKRHEPVADGSQDKGPARAQRLQVLPPASIRRKSSEGPARFGSEQTSRSEARRRGCSSAPRFGRLKYQGSRTDSVCPERCQ
jgi:hypothetical protein